MSRGDSTSKNALPAPPSAAAERSVGLSREQLAPGASLDDAEQRALAEALLGALARGVDRRSGP
ncbi:MAG: hypothetical protein QM756_32045 [Polyangiaceae bacterium]